jgi:hypothetical protein
LRLYSRRYFDFNKIYYYYLIVTKERLILLTAFSVSLHVQTERLRKENSEDMSVAKAIAIVLEQNPHLRCVNKHFLFFIF